MTLELRAPVGNTAAVTWIAAFVLRDVLGLSYTLVQRGRKEYQLNLAGRTLRLPNVFFARWRTGSESIPMPDLPLPEWNIVDQHVNCRLVRPTIPVLFGWPGLQLDAAGNARLGLDVFGSAFFMLARCEEIVVRERDQHDRFPATASIAARAGFLDRPIIDEYIEILWAALQYVWPELRRRPRTPRIRVSHDVDSPARFAFGSRRRAYRTAAADLLKGRNARAALLGPWIRLHNRQRIHRADPHNTFDWIMDLSERLGLISAFYFMCGRSHARYDADYDIGHPAIRFLLNRISQRGHEIGLHPSYNTFRTPERLVTEALRLRQVCAEEDIEQETWGGRMHFLRWETPTTLYGWEAADMNYDSSLGFADRAGFRCGTCHEYRAFDPVQGTALHVCIRPLVAMECTVMAERYMGLGNSDAAFHEFSRLRAACRLVGGDFTLLWHNSELSTAPLRELYEAILTW